MDARARLLKLAGIQDYFLRRDMTPEDNARLQGMLDQQGLPRHPNGPTHQFNSPEPVKDSHWQRGLAHIKKHKMRYGLGAAGLMGAGLLYKKMQDPQVDQGVVMDQQMGF
jgi:hypothetical protein